MEKIIIFDYGSQFTSLIAKVIRKIGVYSEIVSNNISIDTLLALNPSGIILSGGPESVNNTDAPKINPLLLDSGIPILGICYGLQALSKAMGGGIKQSVHKEFGHITIQILKKSLLLDGISTSGTIDVWMSHNDSVDVLPEGFDIVASSEKTKYAIIENARKNVYGVQFHPEVTHTKNGIKILENFVRLICKCRNKWTGSSYITEMVEKLRETVGDKKVFCALSGGIDSVTTALLIAKAIGKERLKCIFIDNGLIRKNTVSELKENLDELLEYKIIDSKDEFMDALKGVIDPEEKRKIIGAMFIKILKAEMEKMQYEIDGSTNNNEAILLAQGTIYPDVIESMSVNSGKNMTIKSHHNVGGLPKEMGNIKTVEPLRMLFKDEVREIARLLGVPDAIIKAHPFPGPGFAIRVIGEVTREKCDILKEIDSIFINELRSAGIYHNIWQAYAALLPMKSVGIMGDSRTYENVCVLKAVESVDGMTADIHEMDYKILKNIARKIVNEVQGVNRVYYDITSKPPATIEIE